MQGKQLWVGLRVGKLVGLCFSKAERTRTVLEKGGLVPVCSSFVRAQVRSH